MSPIEKRDCKRVFNNTSIEFWGVRQIIGQSVSLAARQCSSSYGTALSRSSRGNGLRHVCRRPNSLAISVCPVMLCMIVALSYR